MVVNRRIDMEQDVALRFDLTARPVGKVERLGKQTGEWVELVLFDAKKLDEQAEWAALHSFRRRGTWAVELTVGAGDGELLRIRQDRGE